MMRFNVVGNSGLMLMFMALCACIEGVATVGTVGGGTKGVSNGPVSTDTDTDDTGVDADDTGVANTGGPCGDFTPQMLDWSVQSIGGGDYSIATLLEVEGSEDCYVFDGSHEYYALELFWSNGESHLIERSWNGYDHAGFGPRECGGNHCVIGDIFEVLAVYPAYVGQQELNDLIDANGPPESACGYVANADLVEREYCGPFNP